MRCSAQEMFVTCSWLAVDIAEMNNSSRDELPFFSLRSIKYIFVYYIHYIYSILSKHYTFVYPTIQMYTIHLYIMLYICIVFIYITINRMYIIYISINVVI